MKNLTVKIGVIAIFFVLFSTSCVFGSGNKDKNGNYINKKYDAEKMVNIGGKKTVIADSPYVLNDETQGFAFVIPEYLQESYDNNLFAIMPDTGYVFFIYYSSDAVAMMNSFDVQSCTEDEYNAFIDELSKKVFTFGSIYRLPLNNPNGLDSQFVQYVDSVFTDSAEIARLTDNDVEYVYYFASNSDLTTFEAKDAEKAEIKKLVDEKADFIKNIIVYPPKVAEVSSDTSTSQSSYGSVNGDLSALNATTLDGNTVTADIFTDYDVTMVNIWATWCGPCVSEIPELAKLPALLPENAQLISICTDGDTASDDAKQILETSGATYMTILPNDTLNATLLNSVTAIPTTVFVDSTGKIIGEPVVGVPGSDVTSAYLEKINALLAN